MLGHTPYKFAKPVADCNRGNERDLVMRGDLLVAAVFNALQGSLTQRYVKRHWIWRNPVELRLLGPFRNPHLAVLFWARFCEADVQPNWERSARALAPAWQLEFGLRTAIRTHL